MLWLCPRAVGLGGSGLAGGGGLRAPDFFAPQPDGESTHAAAGLLWLIERDVSRAGVQQARQVVRRLPALQAGEVFVAAVRRYVGGAGQRLARWQDSCGAGWRRAAIKKPPHRAVGCLWVRSIRRRRRCIHPGVALGPASASLLQGSEALASARLLGVQADTGWRRKEKSWRISFGSLGTIAGVLCLSNVLCMCMVDFLCESFVTCTKRYVFPDGLGRWSGCALVQPSLDSKCTAGNAKSIKNGMWVLQKKSPGA